MKDEELDLSAFDEVVQTPDDDLDLSAFDEAAQGPSFMERMFNKVTPSQDTIDTAVSLGKSALDFSKGVARGSTFEGLDEVGGALGAGAERGLGALGIGPAAVDSQLQEQGFTGSGVEQSLGDTYRDYQSGIDKNLKESEERSPRLTLGGQLVGGITSGTALGGLTGIGKVGQGAKAITDIARDSGKSKAALELLKRGGKSYLEAAPFIGLEAGLASDKKLIGEEGDLGEFASDVGGGLAFGLPAVLGLQGVTDLVAPGARSGLKKFGNKLSNVIEKSPLARQTKLAYQKYGRELRVNPKDINIINDGVSDIEKGRSSSIWNTARAEKMADNALDIDSKLGKLVGESLDAPTKAGVKIDARDISRQTFDEIVKLSEDFPTVLQDKNFNATMQKILKRDYNNVSPREIKRSVDEITKTIEDLAGSDGISAELKQSLKVLRNMRKNLDTRLKQTIPDYREAAERFSQHRSAYIEQPIAGRFDPELDDIFYGKMKKGDKKLVEAYEELVTKATGDSAAVENVEANFAKLAEATKKFELEELRRLQQGKIKEVVTPDSKDFMKQIRDYADDSAVRRQTRTTQETQSGEKLGAKALLGLAATGRGGVLTGAHWTGRIVSSKPAQFVARMSRNLYNAPAEILTGLSQKLEATPGLQTYGKALREGMENGDIQKRNAALFTIMQNPKARALVEEDVEE